MVCLIGAPRCYINIAKDRCTPPSWKPNYTTALFQPQWKSAAYIWTPQIGSTVVNCQALVRLESSTVFNGIMIFNLCLTYVIEHGPYTILESSRCLRNKESFSTSFTIRNSWKAREVTGHLCIDCSQFEICKNIISNYYYEGLAYVLSR